MTMCSWNDPGSASNTKRGYLYAYESVSAAHQGLERYVTLFYNQTRPGHTGRLTVIRRMQCTLTTSRTAHGRVGRTSRGSIEATKHSVQSSGATSVHARSRSMEWESSTGLSQAPYSGDHVLARGQKWQK